jgi:YD repeat-containing protein
VPVGEFTYDAHGRVVTRMHPDSSITAFTYDLLNRVTRRIRTGHASGEMDTVRYEYD